MSAKYLKIFIVNNLKTTPFHIIAFDVPFPPNYGGIVDVFYKLKHLHQTGAKIIYHCFYYEGHNPPNEELEKYCENIYYYPRKKSISKAAIGSLPYVVSSRDNKELLENLIKDKYPILFDGIQCCYFLNNPLLKDRKRIYRANNIEHDYYDGLAKWERSKLKKKYLLKEAKRLKKFESELEGVDAILSVAKMDIPHFGQYANTHHIPPFFKSEHGKVDVNKSGIKGKYILFQGNLSVKENEHAVKFILDEIAPKSQHKFVIAGKSPSEWLINEIGLTANVQLIDSPPSVNMEALIQHAHINLLLTFQQTGIKLKLLHALESGKHVLINSLMDDSGIFSRMSHVEDGAENLINKIDELMKEEFSEIDSDSRKEVFSEYFNNENNANKILEIIYA